MGDGIVNELRGSIHRACSGRTPAEMPCEMCKQRKRAADEIERLRDGIAEHKRRLMQDAIGIDLPGNWYDTDLWALTEENDDE